MNNYGHKFWPIEFLVTTDLFTISHFSSVGFILTFYEGINQLEY